MYPVIHQQLFHMRLLSFQLLLFLVMYSVVLFDFVQMFLRTLKCQITKSISYCKLLDAKISPFNIVISILFCGIAHIMKQNQKNIISAFLRSKDHGRCCHYPTSNLISTYPPPPHTHTHTPTTSTLFPQD